MHVPVENGKGTEWDADLLGWLRWVMIFLLRLEFLNLNTKFMSSE